MLLLSENRSVAMGSMHIADIAPILALVFLVILEVGWCFLSGYKFAGFSLALSAVVMMGAISFVYARTGRSRAFAQMAYFAALWIAFTVLGSIFTYLMASLRFPLLDDYFVKSDAAIGFNWLRWYRFLAEYQFVNFILGIAYGSPVLQLVVSIFYFSHTGQRERNTELWWIALISLVLTGVLSGIFPALGAFQYFKEDLSRAIHLPHLLALRDGSVKIFSLQEMQGIITFPSYHTVIAILFPYAYRGKGVLFFLFSMLNILMLLSTPTFGGHYLLDMVSGAVVAGLAIYFVRRVPNVLKLGAKVIQ